MEATAQDSLLPPDAATRPPCYRLMSLVPNVLYVLKFNARCIDSQSCIQAGCVKGADEQEQGRDGFCCSSWTSSEACVNEYQLKDSFDASGASDECCLAMAAMSASALLRRHRKRRRQVGFWYTC